jgi:hypothetical protein
MAPNSKVFIFRNSWADSVILPRGGLPLPGCRLPNPEGFRGRSPGRQRRSQASGSPPAFWRAARRREKFGRQKRASAVIGDRRFSRPCILRSQEMVPRQVMLLTCSFVRRSVAGSLASRRRVLQLTAESIAGPACLRLAQRQQVFRCQSGVGPGFYTSTPAFQPTIRSVAPRAIRRSTPSPTARQFLPGSAIKRVAAALPPSINRA